MAINSTLLSRWRLIAILVVAIGALFWLLDWARFRWNHSITDDAFVESHIVSISPQQVSGHIVKLLVQEHDQVQAGQVLAEIDPTPYREQVELLSAKLEVARAQLASETSALEVLKAQVPQEIEVAHKAALAAQAEQARDQETLAFTTKDVAESIKEAQASQQAAQAVFVLADEDFKRFSTLGQQDVVSQKRAQEATKTYHAAKADLAQSEARVARALGAEKRVSAAQQAVQAAEHQAQKAAKSLALAQTRTLQITQVEKLVAVKQRSVEETQRALQVAQTDLGYTKIVAPFPGVIVHLYRHLGDFAPAGTPILSMFNSELVYVTANLEETKLEGVAPGNRVRIDIDAFSEPFEGRVVWINRATGANFALVPRNVSSGEFTKVYQRVPVRIAIDKDARWPHLRPGLSTTVAIDHGPGDATWARDAADKMRALAAGQNVLGKQ